MPRNNISLSWDELADGRYKVRWREWSEKRGVRERVARSQTVSDKAARDALVAKLRRPLETGSVYEEDARHIPTVCSLDAAALGFLRHLRAKGRSEGTIKVYKSAMARIFAAIREVRRIPEDRVVPADVLSRELFSDMLLLWQRQDQHAKSAHRAGPWRRYDLARSAFLLWRWAASDPKEWPGVPTPPADPSMVLPTAPAKTRAPDAPTWEEMDAIVRRAYAENAVYGDVLLGERSTGLRVGQIESIRRRAIDLKRSTLTVETGKSAAEKADQRVVPVPIHLLDQWMQRIANAAPDDFLFPARTKSGHAKLSSVQIAAWWRAAEDAEEVRRGLYHPAIRRKGRPTHGLRAGYIAQLEAIEAIVDGAPVRRIADKVIDFLVGHHPATTRDRSYSSSTMAQLKAAVAHVPAPDLGAVADNVVSLSQGRA